MVQNTAKITTTDLVIVKISPKQQEINDLKLSLSKDQQDESKKIKQDAFPPQNEIFNTNVKYPLISEFNHFNTRLNGEGMFFVNLKPILGNTVEMPIFIFMHVTIAQFPPY